MFRRNMSPPSSGSKSKPRKKPTWGREQVQALLEDGGDVLLRNFD
jgi:hypothetical protein